MNPSRVSLWALAVIAGILLLVSANLNWGKREYTLSIIKSDGKGYYAYLPAVFIYHDLNFAFYDSLEGKKYYDEHLFYDYRVPYKNKVINKYYCGTALAQFPFFVLAHAVTRATHADADGYSGWYQIGVSVAAIFWLLFGLLYLEKTLILYDVPGWARVVVLFVSVFGTHVFYYTVVEPAMSHVYSWAFVSLFVYASKRYFLRPKPSYLPLLGLALGMVLLIRPVNGLLLLAWPFLAGDVFDLKKGLRNLFRKPLYTLLGIGLLLALLGLQIAIYQVAVGEFFVYAYGNERFDFAHPHIVDILFSYKKGLFLYTPVLLVSLLGLRYLWRESPFQVWTWLAFFGVLTYVLSSWWIWYYGGSFSGRVYVEFIPLFMVLLGIVLRDVPLGWARNGYVSILFLLLVVCQIQTYQYRYYQIHWSDMTREKYWDVFLRPDKI